MDLDVLSLFGGATGASGVALWIIKSWTSRVTKKLDKHEDILLKIQISLANIEGKKEGESALIWREINSNKDKATVLESRVDKAWLTIDQFAAKRSSDS